MNDLVDLAQLQLASAFVVFARVSAVIFLAPAFGEMVVPVRIKLGLAISFTMLLLPSVQPSLEFETLSNYIGLLGVEIVNGLFWGIIIRLSILLMETAGSIASQTTSLSQLFNGAGGEPQPVFSTLLVYGGLALMCLLDYPALFFQYLLIGYEIAPIGDLLSASMIARVGVAAISQAFALAFVLAAPFVVTSLVYNVALGLINKAMPQLMVSFVGAPAISAGSILLLMLAAPIMLDVWSADLMSLLSGARW